MLLPDYLRHFFRALYLPVDLGRLLPAQISLFPQVQTVLTDIQFPRHLPLRLTTVDHQFHRLAFELLPVSSGHLTVLHGCAHFTLSSRVRQIGGGSARKGFKKKGGRCVAPLQKVPASAKAEAGIMLFKVRTKHLFTNGLFTSWRRWRRRSLLTQAA